MIALENVTRTQKTYNLTTRIAPLRRIHQRVEDHRDGVRRVVDKRVVYPDSITLLAGERRGGLPDSYAGAPEIRRAIERGDLKVHVEESSAPTEPEVDVDFTPVEEAPASGRRRSRG